MYTSCIKAPVLVIGRTVWSYFGFDSSLLNRYMWCKNSSHDLKSCFVLTMLNLTESYECMLSTIMLISCWLLCTPLVWEKTWVKDVLSDIINNTTDLVAVIEGFVNYKGEEQAIDRFVDERNHDWDIFFWSNSHLCGMFLEKFVWNKDEEKMNAVSLCALWMPCILPVMDSCSCKVSASIAWESILKHLSGKCMDNVNHFVIEELITYCNLWLMSFFNVIEMDTTGVFVFL